MFRSLFQDYLQGSSFFLSAPTTLQLHASSFVCIGMWSNALYLYVYPVYLPVCCLVVLCTTSQHTQTCSNSSTIAADSSKGVTNTGCCGYSCMSSR
jgi:hypothetical protein